MIRTDKVCWTCYTASLHAKHNNATLGVVVQEIICFHIPQYTHDAGARCKTQKLFPETRLSSDACSDTRTGPQGSIAPNNPLQFHPSHAARFSWSLSSAFNFVPSSSSVFPSLVAPGAVPTCHPIPFLRLRWLRWMVWAIIAQEPVHRLSVVVGLQRIISFPRGFLTSQSIHDLKSKAVRTRRIFPPRI